MIYGPRVDHRKVSQRQPRITTEDAVTDDKVHGRSTVEFENGSRRLVDSLYAIAVSASLLCAHVDELHQGYCTGRAGTGRSSSGWHR